jgi:hypothetical protein
MNEIISLDSYYTDFVTKADRRKEYPDDFNDDLLNNAKTLLSKVNSLLNELGIKEASVTSGWRPEVINNKTTNAAKKSAHMICMAVDILDNSNQDLAKLVANRPDLLKKYSLWLENFQFTRGKNTNWVHLDYMSRLDRPSRMFNP